MSVKIGDTFRSSYADGNPLWRVTSKSGASAWIAVSEDEDYGGMEHAFTTKQVESAMKWARTLSALGNDHDDFFANLNPGEIVHYHNGFGDYVRCQVILGEGTSVHGDDLTGLNVLQPIALVGEWKHDLPRRDARGEVQLGYHAEKVINRTGAWQPSTSCVFEAPGFSGPRGPVAGRDPRDMEAIDLSVPEMDEAEKMAAAAERMRAAMIEVLNDYNYEGREAINLAVNLALGTSQKAGV